MSRSAWRWLFIMALSLAACGRKTVASAPPTALLYPTLDTAQVARGYVVYQQYCASCHGKNAEGAPSWPTPAPDGLEQAPPHDDHGHTWHHLDRVLYMVIHDGMNDPLKPNSPLRMPAWGDKLSDADIHAVIEYFKSLWSPEHRQWQWDETRKPGTPMPMSP